MDKLELINVCFTIDDKYAEYCGVTIVSILLNSTSSFHFYILGFGVTPQSKRKLESLKSIRAFELTFVDVELVDFADCYVQEGTHFSLANYFRLKIPTLLPNIDKVIYLDSDTISRVDLRDLWQVSIDNFYIAGCKSMVHARNCERLCLPIGTPYINSGVMLLNLKKMRNDGVEDMFFRCIKNDPRKMLSADQDVINVTLCGVDNGIKQIKQNWNTEIRSDISPFPEYIEIIQNPYILHFITADKPWMDNSAKQYRDEYLKYHMIALKEYNKEKLGEIEKQLDITFPIQWNNSAIEESYAKYLINKIIALRPVNIVELGSGISSLIIVKTLEKLGYAYKFITVDSDQHFLEQTKRLLIKEGIYDENKIELRFSKITDVEINGSQYKWYNPVDFFFDFNRIDLLFVDGPLGTLSKNTRYPAPYVMMKYLKDDSWVLLHDAKRIDETEIVKLWRKEIALIKEFRSIDTERGGLELQFGRLNQMSHQSNQNTKVIFLSHSSGLGGAEKSMIELVQGLVEEDVICHVLIPAEGLLSEELKKKSIPYDVVFLPWCADGAHKYEKDRVNEIGRSVSEVVRILRREAPDVVYSNSSVIFQGAIAAKIINAKHIWHIREFGELDYGIDFYLPLKDRAKFVYDNSDNIIFISKSLRDYYQKHIPKDKSQIVYNNVQISGKPTPHRISESKTLNLLMLGNVHPAKGQFDAVKAVHVLKGNGIKGIKLVIVGYQLPQYYDEIKNYIDLNQLNDDIEFHQYTLDPSKYYEEADVVLMCSRSEGFGRVTVEAMLHGRPVIGAAAGGTREIIKNKVNGLLYKTGDSMDLASKISFLYKKRILLEKFGNNGREYCLETFSREKYVGRIKKIIEELIRGSNPSVQKLFTSTCNELIKAIDDLSLKSKMLESIKSVLEHTESDLHSLKKDLDERKIELKLKDLKLTEKNTVIESQNSELAKMKIDMNVKNAELLDIYYSRGWRFLIYLRKISSLLVPKATTRKRVISPVYFSLKKVVKAFLKFKAFIKSAILRTKIRLNVHQLKGAPITVTLSVKIYKANRNSKKLVFVDHSYHAKTKSSSFILDYLKQMFEVKVVYDDSWLGKPFADLSFVDESYLGVVFWQSLPSREIINNIRNDNLIYFPMYDSVRWDFAFWDQLRDIKIINFSSTLHKKLVDWGLESIYVQYFPKLSEFVPGNPKQVFFWQRMTNININTVARILTGNGIKIHLHKAVDPGHEYIQPGKHLENRFGITYSDWLEDKSELIGLIKERGIYIAPREYEGIGMSFLEAMAMGKAVIAVDNPTMNEYIIDGVNGYLFDLTKLKEIDLSNIIEVQKNSYESIKKGYTEWEKNKKKIIDFILKQ